MKTLTDMYSAELDKQPENNPALQDIMFLSAFPKVDVKKKTKELSRLSEDLFEDFAEAWTKRIEGGMAACIKEDMTPQLIVASVPLLTREELRTVIAKIDEFIPGDTEELLALRISQLKDQVTEYSITAQEILKSMYTAHIQAKQAKPKILTGPGLTDALGEPIHS